MHRTAINLHNLMVEAGLPIDGVSIGKRSDRSTWVVHWRADAVVSQAQRETAQAIIDAYEDKE